MEEIRSPTAAPVLIKFAAATLVAFLGICALYGWYVGGRPGGWFEGKHLILPLYGWTAACAGAVGLVVLGGLIDLVRSFERLRSWRTPDWLSLAGAVGIFLVLIGNFWVQWCLAIVYAVGDWRRAMWEG